MREEQPALYPVRKGIDTAGVLEGVLIASPFGRNGREVIFLPKVGQLWSPQAI